MCGELERPSGVPLGTNSALGPPHQPVLVEAVEGDQAPPAVSELQTARDHSLAWDNRRDSCAAFPPRVDRASNMDFTWSASSAWSLETSAPLPTAHAGTEHKNGVRHLCPSLITGFAGSFPPAVSLDGDHAADSQRLGRLRDSSPRRRACSSRFALSCSRRCSSPAHCGSGAGTSGLSRVARPRSGRSRTRFTGRGTRSGRSQKFPCSPAILAVLWPEIGGAKSSRMPAWPANEERTP